MGGEPIFLIRKVAKLDVTYGDTMAQGSRSS